MKKCNVCGTEMVKDKSSIYNLSPYADDEYCPKCYKAQNAVMKREKLIIATIGVLFKMIIFIAIIVGIIVIVKYTWKLLP